MREASHSQRVLEAVYPEARATGFTKDDNRIVFFSKVQELLKGNLRVLDFGAGRGQAADLPEGVVRDLMTLKGKCWSLKGYDVDPAVETNPFVDEGLCGHPSDALPYPDEYFELIVSKATFEHIEDPEHVARELERVLAPGGWLCAMTPNKWGFVAMCSALVPNRLHDMVLRRVLPSRRKEDTFPTHYRMNSLRDIRRLFPADRWDDCSYTHSGPPQYHGGKVWIAWIMRAVQAVTPGVQLHVFLRKKS